LSILGPCRTAPPLLDATVVKRHPHET
jgi:hypothetical protein